MNKAVGVAEIEKSLEAEIGRNVHELNRPTAVPDSASAEAGMSAENIGTLLPRMTDVSIGEVDSLIDELQRLRKKLQTDGNLIERAIAQHSDYSHDLMQLTTIIADN